VALRLAWVWIRRENYELRLMSAGVNAGAELVGVVAEQPVKLDADGLEPRPSMIFQVTRSPRRNQSPGAVFSKGA
jgi:hypothetical protein